MYYEKIFYSIRSQVMEAFKDYLDMNMEEAYSKILWVLEEKFGVDAELETFTWKASLGGEMYYHTFKIGVEKIELSISQTVRGFAEGIAQAIIEGILGKVREDVLCQEIVNDGFAFISNITELIENVSLKEIVTYISNERYCDEDFIKMLEGLGYKVKNGDFHGICKMSYIDMETKEKVWLQELYKPYTLYREIRPRTRLEILDILLRLKYRDGIIADEY